MLVPSEATAEAHPNPDLEVLMREHMLKVHTRTYPQPEFYFMLFALRGTCLTEKTSLMK